MIFTQPAGITNAGLFMPSDIGVDSWWDADNPYNNLNNIPAHNSRLTTINDLGIRSNHFDQSSSDNTKKPLYVHNAINGHNAFRFQGTEYMLCNGSANNNYNGSLTITAIASTTNITSGNFGRLLTKGNTPGNAMGYSAGRASNLTRFTTWGQTDFDTGAVLWESGQYQIVTYILTFLTGTSAMVDFYKNGQYKVTLSGTKPGASVNPLYLGSATTTTEFWQGDIQAIFLFFRVLTSQELASMHAYCLSRIGFPS